MEKYEKYKDSGVQWLGMIPEHWKCISLKKILDSPLKYGASESGEIECNDGDYRYIRITDITLDGKLKDVGCKYLPVDIAKDYTLKRGDILFARSGATVGKAYIFDEDMKACFAGYLIKASINNENNPFYIGYYTKSIQYENWKNTIFIQATIQNIGADKYSYLPIPLPPLPEQRSIVSFLDSKTSEIDGFIADTEKQISLLQEAKQKIIVDAVTHGIDKNAKMKDSGIKWIGEIPEHWEVKKVSSLFKQRNEKVSDKDYPALSVSKQGVTPQLDNVALSNAEGNSRKLVKVGDYVVNSRSDRKGSCGVSDYEGSVSLISIVLEPIGVYGKFIHYLFRSNSWVEEFYRNGRGIVADLWATNYQNMKGMFLPIPPISEQHSIVSYINSKTSSIDSLMSDLQKEIDAMKEYKQRLISDVVTGQIKVS